MGLSSQDAQSRFGDVAYTGWDPNGAAADYASKHNGQTSAGNGSLNLSKSVDDYINQLTQETGARRDLMLKKLDAEHKLALGNNDQQGAQFLESVADGLEQKIGRIPYDYQRYNDRELADYSQKSGNITNNKQLALDKLSADEKAATRDLATNQTQTNRGYVEDLNGRGLLTGQTPGFQTTPQPGSDGMFSANPITGLSGLAGSQASIQNQPFDNQFNTLQTNFGLGQKGVNLSASQQQNAADLTHANTMQDLKVDARRGAQDEQNNFQFGTEGANLDYTQQISALKRQQQQLQQQASQIQNTLSGKSKNILGF